MESIDTKKARTHKGRKHLDALKPKLVEDPKKTVFIKGNKTSETITSAMHDLVRKDTLLMDSIS
jgi:ribosome production factor 2